jgi:hypothetical protein
LDFLKRLCPKPIYRLGSKVGKEIERGVESIAKDKILGPIAQMASYLHPVSAFLYAGLAPEGSSFDTKRAAKAAAMQQIGEYALKELQARVRRVRRVWMEALRVQVVLTILVTLVQWVTWECQI